MSGGDDDTVSGATGADRPGAKALAPRPRAVTSEPVPPGEQTLSTMVTPHVKAFLQIALAKSRDAWFPSGAEHAAAFAATCEGALPEPLLRRARKLGRELPWTEPEIAEHKAS